MRIEGEKGVKTQSAPNIGRGRAKEFWPSNFQRADRTVEPGRNGVLGRIDLSRDRNRSRGTHEPERKAAIGRNFRIGTDRPCRSIRETNRPRPKSLDRDKIHRPSAQNFSRPRYTMAKTKGNESMKKKKNPFMEPPKKQIKLGSSSSNARAAIPTSPHSIDAIKNMWRVQEEEKMIGHL
ncbi:unnamed protein product [Microthlaspi erraticum]|uniref:Uncharacterized protein n=1 Tax=Microthlaspi erraticum TaxID=1685480 RepID=A0A6D2J3F5_9BRAS|nr:unnamed protein product [Microthlaspi erraticum]